MLGVVGGFAHDEGTAFEFGGATEEASDEPGDVGREAGEAIDAWGVEFSDGAEEVAVEGDMSDDAFFEEEVSTGGDLELAAFILDLAEVIFGDELGDGEPEIVADFFAGVSGVEEEGRQDGGIEGVAASFVELVGEIGCPGQGSIGHGSEEEAHQGRLVGETGHEVFAEVVTEVLCIGSVGELDEASGWLWQEEVWVGHFGVEIAVGVGALVEAIFGDGEDAPVACGCLPVEGAVAEVRGEVLFFVEVDDAILGGESGEEDGFAWGEL